MELGHFFSPLFCMPSSGSQDRLGEEAVVAFFIPSRDYPPELPFLGKVPYCASERDSKGLSMWPSQGAGILHSMLSVEAGRRLCPHPISPEQIQAALEETLS